MNKSGTESRTIYRSKRGERAIISLYEKALRRWPVKHQFLYIDTSQGKTFVIASGAATAPSLVLLHGSGANSATWIQDVTTYTPKYRVYAVDLPGEPGKSAPCYPDWKSMAYVEWLDDIFRALRIRQAALVGISFGGYVALKYVIHRPEHVSKLAVLCPTGICRIPSLFILRVLFFSALGQWGKELVKKTIFRCGTLSGEAKKFFRLTTIYHHPRLGIPPLLTNAELRSVRRPLLFLAGARDPFLQVRKCVKRLQKFVPDAQIHVYPDQGHVLINLAQTIIQFLES